MSYLLVNLRFAFCFWVTIISLLVGLLVVGLSLADKKRFLEALKEDEEFRLAVAGLLGFREILDRIVRLEERFARLEERQLAVEERLIKREERYTELEGRYARLEERFAELEERFARLEERFLGIEEEMRETRRVVTVVAHRFGVLSESAFREALRYVVERALGVARVDRLRLRDDEGLVYGHPAEIDVDIVIKDEAHILVEVKSRVSRGDVAELYRIGLLYERLRGVRPRLVIVGGFVDLDVWSTAKSLNVEVIPIIKET